MTPPKTKILITGITGYIGGSVFTRLLEHPDIASFEISAIVRSAGKAEKIAKFGVSVSVGSHDDPELMESLASQSDVVIATADADNVASAVATLSGLKKRFISTGVPPAFIRTSGTGVLFDDAVGDRSTDVIYDDTNSAQIDSLPDTQFHRSVDLLALKADEEGYVRTYIVLPPAIYGIVEGPLVNQGIQNRFSLVTPIFVKVALNRGRSGIFGEGKNIWVFVHIVDVAHLYVVLLDSILKKPDTTGHGHDGYYFVDNGEFGLHELGKVIGDALFSLGKIDDPNPTAFTQDEIRKHFGGSTFFGANARSRGTRSRSLGWKPVKSHHEFYTSIKSEVEAVVEATRG